MTTILHSKRTAVCGRGGTTSSASWALARMTLGPTSQRASELIPTGGLWPQDIISVRLSRAMAASGHGEKMTTATWATERMVWGRMFQRGLTQALTGQRSRWDTTMTSG